MADGRWRERCTVPNALYAGAPTGLTVTTERFASYADLHLVAWRLRLRSEEACRATLVLGVDGRVWSLHGDHFAHHAPVREEGEHGPRLGWSCTTGERGTRLEVRDGVRISGARAGPVEVVDENGVRLRRLTLDLPAGGEATVLRAVAVAGSNDVDPATDVGGDPEAQRALRFAIYHARIATPEHSDRPPIGARAKAARLGYRGAFYAWISGDDGAELCPDRFFREVVTGREIRNHFDDWQIHVAPDVAVTVRRYLDATGDERFLVDHGAEILFEVARFLASRVVYVPHRERWEIHQVLGPDEYHENVDDDAFTNHQSHLALRYALDALDALERLEGSAPEVLEDRLIDPAEYWGWPIGVAVHTRVAKQAAVLGFGGLRIDAEALHLAPVLPPGWTRLAFGAVRRGERVAVEVTADAVTVRADDANRAAVPVRVAGRRFGLAPGEARRELRTASRRGR